MKSSNRFVLLITLFILLLFSLISGCTRNNEFSATSGISIDNLWEINESSGFIEPIAEEFNRTVRVNDLVIANESSLKIGEGVIQSRISTNTLLDGSFNRTILVTDRDTLAEANFDGTLYNAVFNPNNNLTSAAAISAFNNNEDALHLMKTATGSLTEGSAFIINENGNLSIITINGTVLRFGVFQNLTERISVSPLKTIMSVNQQSVELSIEDNLIRLNTFTNVEQNLFFRQLNNLTGDTEIPDPKTGFVAMYCKTNNKCYIKQDDGQERRLVDAGGGSYIFDEVAIFSNTTYFTLLNGSGNAYACLDSRGQIFRSNSAC